MSRLLQTRSLGEPSVAEVILGQSPPSSAYNDSKDGLPFFQGKADFGLMHPTPRMWCNAGQKFAKAGDVLMSVRAPVGDVNIATGDCVIGRGVAAIRAGKETDPWFLYFALLHSKPILEARATGSTFASVNKTTLHELGIPFVKRSEQTAIGSVLRLVVERLGKEWLAVETAQELKHAAMAHLFSQGLRDEAQKETEIGSVPQSWDVVSFSTVRQWLQYGTSTRCSTETASYAVLRIPNIGSGAVIPDDLKYCDMPASEAAKYRLELGDLIFIRTNGVLERLGSCAVYRGAPQHALFASYLIRARLDLKRVEPRFVAHFYGSKLGTSLVAGRATPASDGKYNLNTGTIDALPLPVPPTLDEQVEIADILDAIDAKIALHQQKRAVLEELFKALLHKLMTGEIDVNDLDLSALQPAT